MLNNTENKPELYYIHQGTYVGNAMLWWGPNRQGYVTDIREAGKYTRKEAEDIHNNRETDVPYLCEEIDGLQQGKRLIIDMQYVPISQQPKRFKERIK